MGEPVVYIDVDLIDWRFIIVYDEVFGHNALDETGLFTCIEAALEKALTEYKPQGAGMRRRKTKKSKRRARKTRRRHR